MEDLFSEQAADKQIIQSLIQTNQTLWRELEGARNEILSLRKQRKQGQCMKILQDLKGDYYIAKEYVKLAEEDAKEIILHAEHDIEMARKFLQSKEAALNPQPLPPSPVDQGQVNAPADPNAQAAAQLAGDPNQAAQQIVQPPAPAVDPNAQSEQPVMPPLQ